MCAIFDRVIISHQVAENKVLCMGGARRCRRSHAARTGARGDKSNRNASKRIQLFTSSARVDDGDVQTARAAWVKKEFD
jgi:hypothetical protein